MRTRSIVGWVVSALLALAAAATVASAGPLPRIAVSLPAGVALSDIVRVVQACGGQEVLVVLPPVHARIGDTFEAPRGVETAVLQGGASPAASGPPIRLARTYLHLRVDVGDVSATGREREALVERQVADIVRALALDAQGVAGLVVEPVGAASSTDLLQFALATLIIKARAATPTLEVALVVPDRTDAGPGGADLQRLLPYADSVVFTGEALRGSRAQRLDEAGAGKPLILRIAGGAADDGRATAQAFLDLLLTPGAAAASTVWMEVAGLSALRGLCTSTQFLARSLDGGFEMTTPGRAPVAVLADGRPASPAVAFVGSRSADVAVLLRSGGSREGPRALSLATAARKTPQVTCFDPIDGRRLDARGASTADRRDSAGCQADTDYVLFHSRVVASDDRLFEAVSVTGQASLRVEEIIARWQAAREAERPFLDNYSVPCFLVLHFEATSLTSGFDVALELEQFWDRSGVNDWVQTAFRVNGVKLRRGQEFPLPQLEPDKVVTKPLELRLDDKYDYELLGTDTLDGRVCYMVGIKPAEASERLYSGKVWIDGVDFRQVRLRLEQRDGKNNVASHVETQEFVRLKDARGHEFTLVKSIDAEDSVNLAGRSILLEKRYRFGDYTINSEPFATRLAEVRSADDPMFRDTDEGLRELRKQGSDRVVQASAGKRISALLGGVLYDGSRSFPVPLAGITWADFDFRKTGTQLSAFFAGPLFIANLSRQVNKSFRWGADLSVNALPNTLYQYSGSTELKEQRIRNFQQFVGGLLAWQVTSALNLSTQMDLYYDTYRATGDTDPGYRIPASGVTASIYGEAKYVQKGFSAIGTVQDGARIGWRAFGYQDDPPAPVRSNWTRYSLELSQHLFVGKLTRGGISAGYFGGRHLDRFSRYRPSFLERPKINGLPSGVDSFDEVTTVGAYYGFNLLDIAKLQGAYTHAWTRNRAESDGLRQFDGLDFNIGMAGPLGTFVQGSVSLALRGNLDRYTTRWGTYLIFLRPWKK